MILCVDEEEVCPVGRRDSWSKRERPGRILCASMGMTSILFVE